MAFINDQNNAEYRRISLSFRAFNTVQMDMETFNSKSFSGFINRIIKNFKDSADASVAFAVLQETKKWENKIDQLSGRNIDPKWKKALNILEIFEGELPVSVYDASTAAYQKLSLGFDCSDYTLNELISILGKENVVLK